MRPLKQIIEERNVGGLILGLPKTWTAARSAFAIDTPVCEKFVGSLKYLSPWDERFDSCRVLIDEADSAAKARQSGR